MAVRVAEVMNTEVLSLASSESARSALVRLATLGVSGAPVLDADGRLDGVVSWKDLATADTLVGAVMSSPVVTVRRDTGIEVAAMLVAQTGHHRLIVTDEQGRLEGVVSSIDLLRGLVGVPTLPRPARTSYRDATTGLTWSDEQEITEAALALVPDQPGLLVLLRDGAAGQQGVVWAEGSDSLWVAVQHLLRSGGPAATPRIANWLKAGQLRFRYAVCGDASERLTALRTVLYRARDARREHTMPDGGPPPGEE